MPDSNSPIPANAVRAQPLCDIHTSYLVHGVVKMRDDEPWQAALAVAQILIFQAITADSSFHARTEGKIENFSLMLAEMGPPCCALRESALGRVWDCLRQGLDHAAQVSLGKKFDPEFDITTMSNTLRKAARR